MLTEERPETAEDEKDRPGLLSASNVFYALAAISAIGIPLAGWIGTFPGHAEAEIKRDVFVNIPSSLQTLFYVGTGAFLGIMFYLFALRAKNWQRGAGELRKGLLARRAKRLEEGLRMKTLLRDRVAGLMHSMIYYGFLLLFAGTVTLEIDHLLPADWKFLTGRVYQGYSAILDGASLMFLGGLAWAVYRRFIQKPWRLKQKTKSDDVWTLTLLAAIGVSGLLVEAARIADFGRPAYETWSFVGYPLSYLVPESIAGTTHQWLWIAHAGLFVTFLVALPTTKLRHMVTSPANLFLSPQENRPKGAMKAMPNLLEADDIETVGAADVGDFTWKQLFDTDACTMCGRCTEVCPANITGKPLDPREIVLKLGEVATQTAGYPLSPPVAMDEGISISADSVFERITSEEVWACTSCRACDEACPVGIEILDKILDMRRYLALMESDFPSELGKAYVSIENSNNPYGMGQSQRADWTKEVDFPVPILGEDTQTAEYLYWV
ncbi:MAG: 4Fe-4S dicluster domain-containing protein, partial [Acidimicrobiia bacterium]|nr:4Fe-4S dicluster domain-containing protein [Acidimicrobiia bacterium]